MQRCEQDEVWMFRPCFKNFRIWVFD